jgi:hypothetical protein
MIQFFMSILVVTLAVPALAVPCSAVGAPTEGSVYITVVDGVGGTVKGARLESFADAGTGANLASRFQSDGFGEIKGDGIPYGKYDVTIQAPGFPDLSRPVTVSKPEVFIEVPVRTATVRIIPVLNGGEDAGGLGPKVEEFKFSDDGSDLADRFKGDSAMQVPYGIYSLKVQSEGTFSAFQKVYVLKPEVWVVVGLDFAGFLPEHMGSKDVVSGRVDHVPSGEEPIYVRMIGVYLNYVVDDRVQVSGDKGTFSLAGFNPNGEFLLVTFGRTGVLDVRRIQIPEAAKNPIVIDLQQKPSQP